MVYWRQHDQPMPTDADAAALARLARAVPRVLWFPTPEVLRDPVPRKAEEEKNALFAARNERMRALSSRLGMLFLPLDSLERALRPWAGRYRQNLGHWMCKFRGGGGFSGYAETNYLPDLTDTREPGESAPAADCRDDMVNMAMVRSSQPAEAAARESARGHPERVFASR